MRLLTCLMEAEAAYSTAMSAAAKTASAGPLTAPSDSSSLAAALEGMIALPAAAAAGHRQLYLELQVTTVLGAGLVLACMMGGIPAGCVRRVADTLGSVAAGHSAFQHLPGPC